MVYDLLSVGIPLLEKVVRSIAVYLFLVMALRLAGKRELAQLNSFDLVVLLLLSNTVQNAIIGNDNSLLGGLLGATVLLVTNYVVTDVESVVLEANGGLTVEQHDRITELIQRLDRIEAMPARAPGPGHAGSA
jgi:uncharacterized membrane protein YcaP (DUF421 family)